MSEVKTEQTAVDATTAPAQPGATAGQDARNDGDDVDALLTQFDSSVPKPAAAPAPQPTPEPKAGTVAQPSQPDPAVAAGRTYIFRQDMDKTIKTVRGDIDSDRFDDGLVESWLDMRARKDPRLAAAWENRHRQPQAFQRIVAGLGREFQKQYGSMPDKQATEDREAVTAAVRGASTKAPEGQPPKYGGLSNQEYRERIRKDFGFDPGVG